MAAKEKDPAGGLATLYVGDLHPDVTETHLHEKFQPFGPVAMIHVCRDSVARKSLGYAYVNYYSRVDAQLALEKVNYTDIKGRCCRIMWNKKERQVSASQDANIFVKNLDSNIDSRTLYDTFSIFGSILSCKVAVDSDGNSRGYGFVQYEAEDAAKQAIDKANGMLIADRKVFVGPFIKRDRNEQQQGGDGSLYVKNIPGEWEDTQVTDLFAPFGEIASSLVLNDGRSGKRYAFVNFQDPEAAVKALEALNAKDLRTEEEKAAMEEEERQDKEEEKEGQPGEDAEAAESGELAEKEAKKEAKEGDEEEGAEGADKEDKTPSYCLIVSHCKSRAQRDMEVKIRKEARPAERFEGVKLYVRNLPTGMTDETLKALFRDFGTVTDIKAVIDRESGQCKGYGFVRYATMEEATAAVTAMHLKEALPGQPPLHVGLAAGKGGERKGAGRGDVDGKGFFGGKGKGKGKGKGFGMKGSAFPSQVLGGMYAPQQPMMYPQQPGMSMSQLPPRPMFPGMPTMGMFGHPMAMMRPGTLPPAYAQRPGMPPTGALPSAMQMGALGPPMAQQVPGLPAGLTAAALANAPPHVRKQMLGEKLYPLICRYEPQLAGKITGMLLEMDDGELLILLESDMTLREKVWEAVAVLGRTTAPRAV